MPELTPYDTGARCEPKPWPVNPAHPDSYGRVDFENDESATVLNIHVESTDDGYRVVVEPLVDEDMVEVVVHGS